MIKVSNLTDFKVAEKEVERAGRQVLKKEGKEGFDVTIVFIGSEKIEELNQKYRKKDSPTDVLSFESSGNFVFPPGQEKEIGEVVICPEQVAINAKNFNIDFREEIVRAVVHGILHLLGYDHEKDQGEFFQKQKLYTHTSY